MSPRDATPACIATDAALPWRHPRARAGACGFAGAALALLGLAAGAGCGSSSAPHGPPVLQAVYWQVKGQQILVWPASYGDAAAAASAPPAPTQFNLVFDRVIDGSKIEDTVVVNGVSHQQPTAVPPVSVSWTGADMTVPGSGPFDLSVWYNSVHLPVAPANTSYIYGRESPSYPSSTTIAITLTASAITSKYNEPMAEIPPIQVTTDPFSLAIETPNAATDAGAGADDAGTDASAPPARVATDYRLPLQFNNVPADTAVELPKHIEVRQNGTVLNAGEYQLVVDPLDATRVFLQPGSIRIWDSGAEVDVAIAADLPDVFGKLLGVAQAAAFIPCEPIGNDGGVPICGPPMPRGPTDGGADAAADVAADASADGDAGVDDTAVDVAPAD